MTEEEHAKEVAKSLALGRAQADVEIAMERLSNLGKEFNAAKMNVFELLASAKVRLQEAGHQRD